MNKKKFFYISLIFFSVTALKAEAFQDQKSRFMDIFMDKVVGYYSKETGIPKNVIEAELPGDKQKAAQNPTKVHHTESTWDQIEDFMSGNFTFALQSIEWYAITIGAAYYFLNGKISDYLKGRSLKNAEDALEKAEKSGAKNDEIKKLRERFNDAKSKLDEIKKTPDKFSADDQKAAQESMDKIIKDIGTLKPSSSDVAQINMDKNKGGVSSAGDEE